MRSAVIAALLVGAPQRKPHATRATVSPPLAYAHAGAACEEQLLEGDELEHMSELLKANAAADARCRRGAES